MRITPEEVRRIAGLAQLELSDEEVQRLAGELGHILTYIEALAELDVAGIEPLAGAFAAVPGPWRTDAVSGSLAPEEALANAPESDRGHFKVPRVIG